ncbi:NAD(P)/FAD-dependent oxidoreductase [Actinomadura sp. WMMB 499]|uniref:NAD(P)/FAD-dependent oxidoreductase n=1 Tax=Actinomadura sp. WMMB 499 TaxID=1219491 RepID=UPI0012447405|nr:FAD-dependent oxidoreductase [Actinomadura sp. WMMB 499]QFG21313.1 FAD-dependent oxidoreductase [Actinomadura sp. WMMB 499]
MRRIVIVGAGLAGLRATEALRRLGFDGSITLIGAEEAGPYDRPPLSKEVLIGRKAAGETIYRHADYYDDLRVCLRLGRPATALDLKSRTVRSGGRDLPFDGLLLTTGSAARPLTVDGASTGVYLLRTLDDAIALRAGLAECRHVVIIGAGFIGSEVASSARALGLEATLVEAEPVPLSRVVGARIGKICAALHRENGTRVVCGAEVVAVEGGRRVRLADGRVLEGDLVVAGIGAVPRTGWLAGSGLTTDDGLVCDAYLNAGHPSVYAAGDLVRWFNPLFGTRMRTEQWTNAVEQSRQAAASLLAGPAQGRPYAGSNYFWSDQYGTRIQFAGVTDADEIRVVNGSSSEFEFLAYYRRGDRLVGAFAMDNALPLIRSKLLIERSARWDEALASVESGEIFG